MVAFWIGLAPARFTSLGRIVRALALPFRFAVRARCMSLDGGLAARPWRCKGSHLDLPEPPRVVFELPAPCADAARAEVLLRRALAPSVAPHGGWTVTMRVAREGGITHAEAEITDETEAPVAHRSVTHEPAPDEATAPSTRGVSCSALARAVGVWASLVLDAELQRAEDAERGTTPAPPKEATASAWPAPAPPPPRPPPEAHLFLAHEPEGRSVEAGVSWFVMGGTGAGVLVGPTLFTVLETGSGWFLRPQLAIGRTLRAVNANRDNFGTWGAARVDACKRIAGNYLDRRGIQLDTCAGTDLGFVTIENPSDNAGSESSKSGRSLPFFAIGPSVQLRGELGGDFAVAIGATLELNVVREHLQQGLYEVTPSLLVARGELAVSWSFR
jgi:hypothetical protein